MTAALRGSLALLAALALAGAGGPTPTGATPTYIGSAACRPCHAAVEAAYAQTAHARVLGTDHARTALEARGCEACHGPGSAHAASPGSAPLVAFRRGGAEEAERADGACLACHRGGHRRFWPGSAHEDREIGCTSCHSAMKAVSARGLLSRPDVAATCARCHPREAGKVWRNRHLPVRDGALTCTSCHQPHGGSGEGLLSADSVNDVCFRCHADKRGPFLWEHAPVVESCSNCHDPHGGVREHLLLQSMPRLCQACHLEAGHASEARAPGSRFVIGRSCANCHLRVHGSNHPSGQAFTR